MGKEEKIEFQLTGREKDILSILWKADKGMIASEITKESEDLTINTVQAVLKKLMKRNLIRIDQIVYSGTVLTRSYVPTLSEQEFETQRISSNILDLQRFNISPAKFAMNFFSNSNTKISREEADELLALIQKHTEQ